MIPFFPHFGVPAAVSEADAFSDARSTAPGSPACTAVAAASLRRANPTSSEPMPARFVWRSRCVPHRTRTVRKEMVRSGWCFISAARSRTWVVKAYVARGRQAGLVSYHSVPT